MTQKMTKKKEKYWKVFDDNYTFGDERFYLKTYHLDACSLYKTWPFIICTNNIPDVTHIGGQVQANF